MNNQKPRHNHKYPDFLLKNWEEKPWSKLNNRHIRYNKSKHMGEKGYYPDELEDNLSKVESSVSEIFRKLNDSKYCITDSEWWKIIMYVKIQSIRLSGISNFINEPDSHFVGHNNFLFGVNSSDEKEVIIDMTKLLVDAYLEGDEEYISNLISALGIVLWESEKPIFISTDAAVFKEVDLDGKFLFAMMPISPRIAVVVSKNSYFSSYEKIEQYKSKFNDPYVSNAVDDGLLINHFNHNGFIHINFKSGRPRCIPKYKVEFKDIKVILSCMASDAENLVFNDNTEINFEDLMKIYTPGRKINNTMDDWDYE